MPVAGYHVIITNYGFWLPNDPRGSWSDYVRSWELYAAGGPATKITTRRSVAAVPHDQESRKRAKAALARRPVVFTGKQAHAVGAGFAQFVARSGLQVFACAIMPRHTHLVIGRSRYEAEQAVNLLKGAATTELTRQGLHPFADARYQNGPIPIPWARKQWIAFLRDDAEFGHAITYVELNPSKETLLPQRLSPVVPYSGSENV